MNNNGKFTWPRTKDSATQRAQDSDALRVRGTSQLPPAPTFLRLAKSGTKLTADWDAPIFQKSPITGWRVYLDTEINLVQAIKDAGCTHAEITITANTNHNVFVSSVNALGKESALVNKQI